MICNNVYSGLKLEIESIQRLRNNTLEEIKARIIAHVTDSRLRFFDAFDDAAKSRQQVLEIPVEIQNMCSIYHELGRTIKRYQDMIPSEKSDNQ